MKRTQVACVISLLVAALAAPALAQSRWIVSKGKSTRDNSPSVSMMLVPDKGPVGLNALCIQGNTQLAFVPLTPPPLPPNSGTLDLSYRIDTSAPRRRSFAVSGNGKDFTITGAPAIEMLKELLTGEKLFLRYELPSGAIDAAEYTITGLDVAIRPFREVCRW